MDKVFLGSRASRLLPGLETLPITKVELLDTDGELLASAGDDAGRTVTATQPDATDDMAESVLSSLSGYRHQPYEAMDALLDPAAELGDGVTVGGVYSVLARRDISFGRLYTAEISAPAPDETEDKYPYHNTVQRAIAKSAKATRSLITKTAEEIRLEVADEVEGVSSKFSVQLDGIRTQITGLDGDLSKLEQTANSLSTQISAANGNISSLQQTANSLSTRISNVQGDVTSLEQSVDSITLSVTNRDSYSTIRLQKDGITLASERIEFTGVVLFSDLDGSSGTIIDGGAIDTDTIYLDSLYGSTIYIYGDRYMAGRITTEEASSWSGRKLTIDSGAIEIDALVGDIYLESGDGTSVTVGGGEVSFGGDVIPRRANSYSCGTYGFPWSDVYSTDGTISASDRNNKFDIDYDMAWTDALFDGLRPCSFRRTNGTSYRRHTGLIAQEVAALRDALGIPSSELAAYCEWETESGETGCGLRYEEWTAVLIRQIQQLKARVAELERRETQ